MSRGGDLSHLGGSIIPIYSQKGCFNPLGCWTSRVVEDGGLRDAKGFEF